MSKAKTTRKLVPFDAARYLTDDDVIAEYVSAVLEMGEPDLLLMALSDVARARGVALSIAGLHLWMSLSSGPVVGPNRVYYNKNSKLSIFHVEKKQIS